MVELQGIIHGQSIQLLQASGLQDGTVVLIKIEPQPLSLEEKRLLIQKLCGAWATDSSLPAIFAEIEQARDLNNSREVFWDDTP